MIIGCSGSGKTTLAQRLGALLQFPVHCLDKHFWKEHWVGTPWEEWLRMEQELLKENRWIIDGNYAPSLAQRMCRADTIIFLDFRKVSLLWRVCKRYYSYFNRVRPDMGGNNKERLDIELVRWIMGYPRKEVLAMVTAHAENRNIFILRNDRQIADFLRRVKLTISEGI